MPHPTVSVVLPAYNAARTIEAAVESLLRQSFADFELLVIDDGSTDGTSEVVTKSRDTRIHILQRRSNRGLVSALNEGLEAAQGKYIARMDADDIALPRRLELQVSYLERNSAVGICGTWFWLKRDRRRSPVRTPTDHDEIAAHLFFRSAFGHPTVMLRRALLQESGLRYDPLAVHAEDFDLWVRARDKTRLANLPKYLLEYRVHSTQTSYQHNDRQSETATRIRLTQLSKMVPGATPSEQQLHLLVCGANQVNGRESLIQIGLWLDKLREANKSVAMFRDEAFAGTLAFIWADCCSRALLPFSAVLPIYFGKRYAEFDVKGIRKHAYVLKTGLRKLMSHPY